MRVKITKSKHNATWYVNYIGREFEVEHFSRDYYKIIRTSRLIHKEDCKIVEELNKSTVNNTVNKINSEFYFTKEVEGKGRISLILYIDYQTKTYDFMQSNQEGIFPRKYNSDTEMNKAVFEDIQNYFNNEFNK